MILVTGATGNLGSAAITQLLKNTSAKNIAVLARDENKAKHLKEKGIDVRIGSYEDIGSLDLAMQGIDKLLMISSSMGKPVCNITKTCSPLQKKPE